MSGQGSLYDIYNAMQDMVFVADYATLRVIYANKVAQTVTGYSEAELYSSTLSMLYPGLNRARLYHESSPLVAHHNARYEEVLRLRDGSSILTQVRINLGQVSHTKCLICVAFDVRDQQMYEQQLKENQILYRSLVDAVPDLLFRIRRDGTYLDYKVPEGLGLVTPKPEDIIGKKVADIVPAHVANLAMPVIERVVQTLQVEVIEYTIQESGGLHYFEARFVPSVEGEVIAVVHDVTASKQAEAALRESEEMARALLDASPNLAFLMDRNWIVLAANGLFAKKFNKTMSTLIGTCVWDYLPPNVAKRRKAIAEQIIQSHQPVTFEDINQDIHYINTGYPLFDAEGNVSRLAIFAQDVTEQKRNEEMLHRQRALLEGVASATNRLLVMPDYTAAINEALAILGNAISVDRIFIFEKHFHTVTGEKVVSYRFEWTSSFVHPQIQAPFLQNLKWDTLELIDWYNKLAAGEVILNPTPLFDNESFLARGITNIRALLVVPIFTSNEFWGCIGFGDYRIKRDWVEEEVSVLRMMAASIGAAIEREKIEARLKRERESADILRDIGTVLTSTLKFDEVLGRLLEQVRRVIPYDAANVMLIEGETARVVRGIGYEQVGMLSEEIEAIAFDLDKAAFLQTMIQTHIPCVCPDTASDPSWVRISGTEWLLSWLGAPIIVRDEVVGFFSLDSVQKGFYGPEHLAMIAPFAQQAAIAFENAQLFAEVQGLDRVKSQMIRIASHDLRSPLTRIQNFAQRLQEQLDCLLTPGQRMDLVKIREATSDMEQIIGDILSLDRIEANLRAFELLNWCAMIDRSVNTLRFELEANHHTLTITCAPDLPVMRGDPVQLEHAILNMLQNAIKYTPPGGRIEVRAFLKMYGDKPTVAVEIQDNGIGVPADRQERLFEPFYRVRQAGTEDIPGTGLGLSVVKAAVEYHQGHVYLDSAPGEGSLFGFWIPV